MFKRIAIFSKQEDGAVTVDWVVLTAAIVGLAVFIGLFIAQPMNNIDDSVGQQLTNVSTDVGAQTITVTFGVAAP